jgi:sugar lactone lactonase YvrE
MAVVRTLVCGFLLMALATASLTVRAADTAPPQGVVVERIASGLRGAAGATIGPDHSLYVAESAAGAVARVDLRTGRVASYATGLPRSGAASGGVVDVAFLGQVAYALLLGGGGRGQVNRITSTRSTAWVADVGVITQAAATADGRWREPQPVLQASRGALLVSDGHHHRVLRVTRRGAVTEFRSRSDLVPTGLDASSTSVFVAEVGRGWKGATLGKVSTLGLAPGSGSGVAAGPSPLLDVEVGRCSTVYVLSEGERGWHPPDPVPAPPYGELLRANQDGTLTAVVGGFSAPIGLEIVDDAALVLTGRGDVWRVSGLSGITTGSRDGNDLCRANISRDDARESVTSDPAVTLFRLVYGRACPRSNRMPSRPRPGQAR